MLAICRQPGHRPYVEPHCPGLAKKWPPHAGSVPLGKPLNLSVLGRQLWSEGRGKMG